MVSRTFAVGKFGARYFYISVWEYMSKRKVFWRRQVEFRGIPHIAKNERDTRISCKRHQATTAGAVVDLEKCDGGWLQSICYERQNERAISLARPRPLDSDFRRSGSASGSQLWLSPNHLGLTNLRPLAPRSSQITVAARTCSPPSFSSCLARVSLPILEDDCLFALSSGRLLFR
jgi:hypothetical protein